MTKPPAVDIHSHFFPEAYLKLIADEGARFGVRLNRENPKGPAIEMGAARLTGPLRAAFSDLDLRRRRWTGRVFGFTRFRLPFRWSTGPTAPSESGWPGP